MFITAFPRYHFPSLTPKIICPKPPATPRHTHTPLQPTQPSAPCTSSLSSSSQSAGMEKKGPLTHAEGGKWCGVEGWWGSQCSWSLIVWLVCTSFSSWAFRSHRGEEREEISDGTSPPCGLVCVGLKNLLIVTAAFFLRKMRRLRDFPDLSVPINQRAWHLFAWIGFATLPILLKIYPHIFSRHFL